MYIYLDESGDFYSDEYFVVGGFLTGDQRRTAKAFRKWQHSKFPKKIRAKTEVKFSDSGLHHALRLRTLEYFAKQDIRVFYAFLKRENIPLEFRKKKGIESGRLYTEIVAQTLGQLFPSSDTDWNILIDQRHLKKVSRTEFKETIKLHILLQTPRGSRVYVDTDDSTTNTNIQIADWICAALYRYHMRHPHGQQLYDILKNNIVASKELFKDYWNELHRPMHLTLP